MRQPGQQPAYTPPESDALLGVSTSEGCRELSLAIEIFDHMHNVMQLDAFPDISTSPERTPLRWAHHQHLRCDIVVAEQDHRCVDCCFNSLLWIFPQPWNRSPILL